MFLSNFRKLGYVDWDIKKSRGYRKRNLELGENEIEVHIADGRRKGQFYYEKPSYNSTKYFYRVYLIKEEDIND